MRSKKFTMRNWADMKRDVFVIVLWSLWDIGMSYKGGAGKSFFRASQRYAV
jgi:hypothetical protein